MQHNISRKCKKIYDRATKYMTKKNTKYNGTEIPCIL